jgi:hypothetical protein
MKKTELLSMLVRDLKALAKKMKIEVPERAKKADIVDVLLAAARINKKPEKKKTLQKKAPVTTAAKARKTEVATAVPTPKVAVRTAAQKPKVAVKPAAQTSKAAVKTAVRAPKAAAGTEAPKRQSVPKRAPAPKTTEPVAAVHDWKIPPGTEEPLLAQERVSNSKYYTGPANQPTVAERGELPRTYGQDRIVLMTRDPFVVHAYWETSPERLEREKAWFGWGSKLSVRIYDITGVQFDGRNAIGYYDQEVSERTGTWYFDLGRPSHSFCADLGLLSPEGQFLTLARSNYVNMPRDGVSDVIDEEWMLVDEEFWKLYGYPEGFRGGVSSRELQEMMRRRRQQEVTSPGLFSRERTKSKRK